MRSRQPRQRSDGSPQAAAAAGLILLGRRELTSSQLRERLLRQGFPEESVADAIARLTERGVVDDGRAAAARARHGANVHRHGRARVLREVKATGVPDEVARAAVAAAFEDVDETAVLTAALNRKLRGGPVPAEPRARRRLYAWLLRQGFEPLRIQGFLKAAGASGGDD